MRVSCVLASAAALGLAQPVAAAEMVSAMRPETLAAALSSAGHQATLGADDTGDPVLDLNMRGYKARLLFMDCDEQVHNKCRSVQFVSSFDAEGAGLTPADALRFAGRYRYAAVTLNGSGDPTLRWDIETGSGIPADVFITAADRFLSTVQAMAGMLYPEAGRAG
jgi:hypothetical protein